MCIRDSHGAVYVARELAACGADWFAVSNIEEAVELRRAGLSQPVLILGYTPPQLAGELASHRISQTVFSTSYGEALSKGAVEAGVAVNIHIKIDTGMSRLGFFCQQEDCAASIDEAAQVCTLPGLVPEGIFTHFAVSDEGEEGEAFTQHQFEQFCRAVDALCEKGIRFRYRHCCNSAGVLCYPQMLSLIHISTTSSRVTLPAASALSSGVTRVSSKYWFSYQVAMPVTRSDTVRNEF